MDRTTAIAAPDRRRMGTQRQRKKKKAIDSRKKSSWGMPAAGNQEEKQTIWGPHRPGGFPRAGARNHRQEKEGVRRNFLKERVSTLQKQLEKGKEGGKGESIKKTLVKEQKEGAEGGVLQSRGPGSLPRKSLVCESSGNKNIGDRIQTLKKAIIQATETPQPTPLANEASCA